MAQDIKRRIVLEGEKEYSAAIREAQRNLRTLRSELKAETAELGANATAQQKNETRAKSLQKQIQEQEKIVQTLRAALEEAKTQYGDNEEVVAKWEQRLNDARATLANMRNSLSETGQTVQETDASFRNAAAGAMGTAVAAKSAADSMEELGGVGEAVAEAIEGIFSGMISVITEAVSAMWDMVSETAAKANGWEDIAGYWGTDTQTIQQYARAVSAAGNSFEDLNSAVSRLALGGKGDKITELLGISQVNYQNDWAYAMAVLDQMHQLQSGGQNITPIFEEIFGEKKSTQVMDLLNDWETITGLLDTFGGDNGGFGISSEALSGMAALHVQISTVEEKWDALKDKFAAGLGTATGSLLVNVEGSLDSFNDFMNAQTPQEREAALSSLRTNVEEFFTKVGEILSAGISIVSDVGKELQGSDDPYVAFIGDVLTGLTGALDWIAKNANGVKEGFEIIFGAWLIAKIAAMAGSLGSILGKIESIRSFNAANVTQAATQATSAGEAAASTMAANAQAAAESSAQAATSWGNAATSSDSVSSAASSAQTSMAAGGSSAQTSMTSGGAAAETSMTTGGSSAQTSMTSGGTSAQTSMTSGGSSAQTAMTSGGSSAKTSMTSGGTSAQTSMTSGGTAAKASMTTGGAAASGDLIAGGVGAAEQLTTGAANAAATLVAGGVGAASAIKKAADAAALKLNLGGLTGGTGAASDINKAVDVAALKPNHGGLTGGALGAGAAGAAGAALGAGSAAGAALGAGSAAGAALGAGAAGPALPAGEVMGPALPAGGAGAAAGSVASGLLWYAGIVAALGNEATEASEKLGTGLYGMMTKMQEMKQATPAVIANLEELKAAREEAEKEAARQETEARNNALRNAKKQNTTELSPNASMDTGASLSQIEATREEAERAAAEEAEKEAARQEVQARNNALRRTNRKNVTGVASEDSMQVGERWEGFAEPEQQVQEAADALLEAAESLLEEPTDKQQRMAETYWDYLRTHEPDERDPVIRDALMDYYEGQDDLMDRLDDVIQQLTDSENWQQRENLPANWWLEAQSWRNAGNNQGGISSADLQGFRSLPAAMSSAVAAGAARGVSGITVQLDGYTVGRLVAPYVSETVARDVIIG